ncbi:hypothetical protein AYI70_g1936 [Smittium culicis]|uniref:Uncharacterized protein n=1 Tax=Smittium culicis TaxID=133412 RepID=A0A1R1YAM4_9FUNG|nr:hypothetical protein AYI70_g1936 [Smittium culicis]
MDNVSDKYVPTIELIKCTNLLTRKTTDDEKIAGLMVLPYLLSNDPTDELKAHEYVFKRFEWKFVKRLLTTGIKKLSAIDLKIQDNSSEIEQANSYISLSLYIIAAFVCKDVFSNDFRLISLVPTVCKAGSLGNHEFNNLATQIFCGLLMVKDTTNILSTAKDWIDPAFDMLKNVGKTGSNELLIDGLIGSLFHSYKNNNINTSTFETPSSIKLSKSSTDQLFLFLAKFSDFVRVDPRISPENTYDFEKTQLDFIKRLSHHFQFFHTDLASFLYSQNPSLLYSLVSNIANTCLMILQQKNDDLLFKLDSLNLGVSLMRNWPEIMFGRTFNNGSTVNSANDITKTKPSFQSSSSKDGIKANNNPESSINVNLNPNLKYVEVGLRISLIEASIFCDNLTDLENSKQAVPAQVSQHGLDVTTSFINLVISSISDILMDIGGEAESDGSKAGPELDEYKRKMNGLFAFSIDQGKEISASVAEFVLTKASMLDGSVSPQPQHEMHRPIGCEFGGAGEHLSALKDMTSSIQLLVTVQSYFDDMVVDADRMAKLVRLFSKLAQLAAKFPHIMAGNNSNNNSELLDDNGGDDLPAAIGSQLASICAEIEKFVSSANSLNEETSEWTKIKNMPEFINL